jgi:hypothetical protein
MLVESGYPIEKIYFDRPERAAGLSKNKLKNLINFGWIALGSSSRNLLRAPLYLAFILLALAPVTLVALIFWSDARGALAMALGAEILFGAVFAFLGLIGEQVRVIAEMVRGKPMVTERERINF